MSACWCGACQVTVTQSWLFRNTWPERSMNVTSGTVAASPAVTSQTYLPLKGASHRAQESPPTAMFIAHGCPFFLPADIMQVTHWRFPFQHGITLFRRSSPPTLANAIQAMALMKVKGQGHSPHIHSIFLIGWENLEWMSQHLTSTPTKDRMDYNLAVEGTVASQNLLLRNLIR